MPQVKYATLSFSKNLTGQAIAFGEENRYYYFSAESGFVFLVSFGNLEMKYYPEYHVNPVKDKNTLDSLYSDIFAKRHFAHHFPRCFNQLEGEFSLLLARFLWIS